MEGLQPRSRSLLSVENVTLTFYALLAARPWYTSDLMLL